MKVYELRIHIRLLFTQVDAPVQCGDGEPRAPASVLLHPHDKKK